MKKLLLVIFLQCCAFSIGHTQFDSLSIEILEKKFKSFEYPEVILLSDQLLTQRQRLTEKDLIAILEIKAVSYYSLGETDSSGNSFIEILKTNPAFELDTVKTSPKIINFFEEVRSNFFSEQEDLMRDQQALDSLAAVIQSDAYDQFRGSIMRSIFLPGWGHLHSGYSKKGWFLTAISAATLGTTIYFTLEAHSREKAYLNETERTLIDSKYHDYNSAYKTRNILIAAYAAIWLYSQIDLLYLSQKRKAIHITSMILPPFHSRSRPTFALRLTIKI